MVKYERPAWLIPNLETIVGPLMDLKNKDSYNKAVEEIDQALISNEYWMASIISLPLFKMIEHRVNRTTPEVAYEPSVFNEDVALLDELLAYNEDTFYVVGPLKAQMELLVNTRHDELLSQIYANQLIKGLVDLYGYITLKDLSRILHDHYDLDYDCETLRLTMLNNLMFNYTCFVTDEYVVRHEIYEHLTDFLKRRKKLMANKDYCIYSEEDVLHYANSFSFNGSVTFPNDGEVSLFTHKVRQQNFENIYPGHEDEYDMSIPKWLLKGYSYNAYKGLIKNEQK